MNTEIENVLKVCVACQSIKNLPSPVQLLSWPCSAEAWERIHIDYAGLFMDTTFLVVVDTNSKWLEVLPMKNTTTEITLDALRTIFCPYGVPKLVSDNGSQFMASGLASCMAANHIEHLMSAPYHSATNGEAERFVQTFKNSFKAGRHDQGTFIQVTVSPYVSDYPPHNNCSTSD